MLALKYRSVEWSPTAWQRFQLEENTPNSLLWHLKHAQDESLSLRERCEHALQVFERRQREYLITTLVLLSIISFLFVAFAVVEVLDTVAARRKGALIACLIVMGVLSPGIHASILGTYAARQVALRIKSSLQDDCAELYLPTQSLLRGRYRLLLRSPWFCEVTEKSGEDTEPKGSTFKRFMLYRRWDDLAGRNMAPEPSAIDLSLRTATDPNCAAHERAEAAFSVFAERSRHHPMGPVLMVLYALITGGPTLFCVVLGLRHGNPLALGLVLICWTSCVTSFILVMAFKLFIRGLVAYHVKSRIKESLPSVTTLELPLTSKCLYYFPSDTLLRKGCKLVRMYPYYEELEEDVQDVQDVQDAECEPKDVKFHEGE